VVARIEWALASRWGDDIRACKLAVEGAWGGQQGLMDDVNVSQRSQHSERHSLDTSQMLQRYEGNFEKVRHVVILRSW
jgi:hypothetical protein